ELVGALGVVEALEDALERGVVDLEGKRQLVGVLAAGFALEVEEARVVALVRLLEEAHQALVEIGAGEQLSQVAGGFDAAVLADAEEDDAVDDPLDGEVEGGGVKRIAQGDVGGQLLAPVLDLLEEGVVELLGAAAFLAGDVAVEIAGEDGPLGEGVLEEIPAGGVFGVVDVVAAGDGGLFKRLGLDAGVVDRQFFEVGQQGDRELGAPGVAAELVGWFPVALDVDVGLLG